MKMGEYLGVKLNQHYLNLVDQYREEDRNVSDIRCQYHHIVPRCIGGLDIEENLVKVTKEHHTELHGQIMRGFKGQQYMKLLYAYHKMKWDETPKEHAERMRLENKRKRKAKKLAQRNNM